jgi:hypothetical protein
MNTGNQKQGSKESRNGGTNSSSQEADRLKEKPVATKSKTSQSLRRSLGTRLRLGLPQSEAPYRLSDGGDDQHACNDR